MAIQKGIKPDGIIYQKVLLRNDQPINSDVKISKKEVVSNRSR